MIRPVDIQGIIQQSPEVGKVQQSVQQNENASAFAAVRTDQVETRLKQLQTQETHETERSEIREEEKSRKRPYLPRRVKWDSRKTSPPFVAEDGRGRVLNVVV
ncbi:MAG: hypothetical protein HQK58_10645 [Deltaproteobacteria bacterium]|nr:hypothetical protein [Deltaproteobacteria bacterium]